MKPSRINGLYAITPDINDSQRLISMVDAALAGGIDILQYRNKSTDKTLRMQQASELLLRCRAYHVPLIINDDVDLASQIGADGVHLGASDGSLIEARKKLGQTRLIGATCYNQLELAQQAIANGADYVAFGSMFSSVTKPAAVKAPLNLLRDAKNTLQRPVVAIGGIGLDNIAQIASAGADAAAIISELFDAENIVEQAKRLRQAFFLPNQNGR
jgi:thiamine-phosphate pyrophosphorylase